MQPRNVNLQIYYRPCHTLLPIVSKMRGRTITRSKTARTLSLPSPADVKSSQASCRRKTSRSGKKHLVLDCNVVVTLSAEDSKTQIIAQGR